MYTRAVCTFGSRRKRIEYYFSQASLFARDRGFEISRNAQSLPRLTAREYQYLYEGGTKERFAERIINGIVGVRWTRFRVRFHAKEESELPLTRLPRMPLTTALPLLFLIHQGFGHATSVGDGKYVSPSKISLRHIRNYGPRILGRKGGLEQEARVALCHVSHRRRDYRSL